MNADGTGQKPLTPADEEAGDPQVAPDGRSFFYSSLRSKTRQIWRADIDGSNARRLTDGIGVAYYSLSPDGRWLLYNHWAPGLWKIPSDGGQPIKLLDDVAHGTEISPDGKLLAYNTTDEKTKRARLVIRKYDDLSVVKTVDLPVTSELVWRWTRDSRALVYEDSQDGISNLWRLPVKEGQATRITDFKSDYIYYFAYSHDGRQVALSRGNLTRDAVIISDER